MKTYHVIVDREDDWYVARALEDSSVFTQGRSLDEITENIRGWRICSTASETFRSSS